MNIFNTLCIGMLTLALFAPTIISESLLFPFITGKNFWFRGVVLAGAIIFAYIVYKKRQLIKIATPVHLAFGLFVGVLLLADIFGVSPMRSLFSGFERMEGWFTHALLLLLFLLLTQVVRTLDVWRNIFKVSLIANVYVLTFAFSQYFGTLSIFQHSDRIDATLGNATYLAGYAMMYAFIVAWLAYTTKNISARYLYGIIGVLNIFISFVTLTRGAALGITAGVLLSLALIAIFEKRYTFMRYVGGVAFALVLVSSILLFSNRDSGVVQNSPVLNRIASISTGSHTATSRLLIWDMSFQGFKERPLLGWGQDNFLYVFSSHFDPRMAAYEPWYDRSHNVFFDWMVAGGTLGLLAYLALFATPIYIMWFARSLRQNFSIIEKSLWTGLLGAYFVFNLFVFDNIASYILFVFILAYITWKAYASEKETIVSLSKQQSIAIAALLSVIGVLGMYSLVYKPIITGSALIQGMQYTEVIITASGDAQAQAWTRENIGTAYTREELSVVAREKFKRATAHPLGRTEAREQLGQRLVSIVRSEAISNEEKNEWVNLTLTQLEDEIKRDPKNPRTLQITGLLLLQFGKTQEAIELLNKTQELSPNKQLVMFDRALAYQVAGDYEKAVDITKQAYDLNPAFLTARAKYILALYRARGDAEATVLEPQFLQDALAQNYDFVVSKAYESQVQIARIEYRAKEAVEAYQKGDMATYLKYYAEIKALNPDSALRLTELVKTLK